MNTKFTFEAETFVSNGRCNTIEVELRVRDSGWEIETLWDLTQCVRRDFKDFSEQDRKDIERLADKYAAIAEQEET